MSFVVTLIADPEKEPLTQTLADNIGYVLELQGITATRRDWLKPSVALDLYIDKPSFTPPLGRGFLELLDDKAQEALRGYPIDAIVQVEASRRKKLLVADMESTIITIEALDELAEYVGLKDKIAAITARAMNGELDFEAAITERVALLAGLSETALQEVYDTKAKLMPGAEALVSTMKQNGAHCMLVSGGFDFFTSRVRDRLGFHEDHANRLEIENGKLTGRVLSPILGKKAKLHALQEACGKLGITPYDAVAVGDGANDLPMLLEAGLGVAFRAKPTVRAQAREQVNYGDLTALLFAQGYRL